jgi:hypothetical protein
MRDRKRNTAPGLRDFPACWGLYLSVTKPFDPIVISENRCPPIDAESL